MKNAIRYFGYVTFALMALGVCANFFREGGIHPLLALFTLVVMYYLFRACWFTLRYLFWFDELREEYDRKAGERIVPRDRLTWELLTCWSGSTPRATRWRRRYNVRAIFAILMCCSVMIYGLLIYLVLGFLGGSSGSSGGSGSSDGPKETPLQHRTCDNCMYGSVDGCQLAGGNRAGLGGTCSHWRRWE